MTVQGNATSAIPIIFLFTTVIESNVTAATVAIATILRLLFLNSSIVNYNALNARVIQLMLLIF